MKLQWHWVHAKGGHCPDWCEEESLHCPGQMPWSRRVAVLHHMKRNRNLCSQMFSCLMEAAGCSNKSQLWTRSCGEAGWHIQLLSHPLLTKDSKLPIVLYFLAHYFEKALQTQIRVFGRMKVPLTFRNGSRIIRHRQSFLHRKWNKLKYCHRYGHWIYQRFFWALRKPETCCFSANSFISGNHTDLEWPKILAQDNSCPRSPFHSQPLVFAANTDNSLTADHCTFGTTGVKPPAFCIHSVL